VRPAPPYHCRRLLALLRYSRLPAPPHHYRRVAAALGRQIELVLRWRYNRELDFFADDDGHPTRAPNELCVALLNGRDLPIMDRRLLGGGGSSDPVARLSLGAARLSSSVCRATLEPEWNETFALPAEDVDDLALVLAGGGGDTEEDGVGGEAGKDKKGKKGGNGAKGAKGAKGGGDGGGATASGGGNGKGKTKDALTLEITLEDDDRFSAADFMGRLSLPLDDAALGLGGKRRARRWHRLLGPKKTTKADADDGGGDDDEAELGELELVLRRRYNPKLDYLGDDDGHASREPNAIRVTLVQARGLRAMDSELLSSGAFLPCI
jgi:hypothetical protein